MSLLTRIREAASDDPTGDPREIAKSLISRAQREEFLNLLADYVRDMQRHLTAEDEKSAFRELLCNGDTLERAERTAAMLDKLQGKEFILGRGLRTVEHLYATSNEHRIRAAYLRKLASDLEVTAHRHDIWADAIDEAGVTCLAELGDREPEPV